MRVDEIIARLDKVKNTGQNKWQAACPAHEDKRASLSVSVGDAGQTLVHCHAGCSTEDVVTAMGLTILDFFPEDKKRQAGRAGGAREDIIYDYRDADGKLLMQAIRRPGKSFCQRKPDGHGGWSYKLGGIKRVLYRLPELLAKPDDIVFIVEGEKDVDNLWAIGLVATCNVGGAGKWRKDYCQHFAGRRVVVLPDNDDPGRKHALQVAELVSEVTDKIKIVELPGLEVKGDVSDWLAAGGTREKLIDLVKVTDRYIRPAKRSAGVSARVADFELSDIGNGRRFAALYRDKIRFCYSLGSWMVWDGAKWDLGRGEAASRLLAIQMIEGMAEPHNPSDIKQWARECGKSSRVSNTLLEAKPHLAIYSEQLDSDLWLLNVANGVVDLRTGKLLPHDPDLLMTRKSPVTYDPEARYDPWYEYLDTVLQGDVHLMAFLRNAIGYSLTGSTREEKLFLVHGDGAAGKSTFVEAIKSTLGDYATTTDFETFLASNNSGGPRNDIARLAGSRFVASIEVDDGRKLAEGLVKTITGSDTITARHLYREAFEFRPQFKLWLCANHEPRVRGDDDAIWRRILRVPFDYVIPECDRDPGVKEALTDPAVAGPAILRWAVEGCLYWQAHGLEVPERVVAATQQYRAKMDPLADWIEECVEFVEGWKTPVTFLRGDYDKWAEANGVKFTVGRNTFNEYLRHKGLAVETVRCGLDREVRKCWIGIKLLDDVGLQI